MQAQKKVYGHFSINAGSNVRRMYDGEGNFLGTIRRRASGGYEVKRLDGKVRVKSLLSEAYRSIARAN